MWWGWLFGLCAEVLAQCFVGVPPLPLCKGPTLPSMALPTCTPPDLDMVFHMVGCVVICCSWLWMYSLKEPWLSVGEGLDTTEKFQKKYPHDPHISRNFLGQSALCTLPWLMLGKTTKVRGVLGALARCI